MLDGICEETNNLNDQTWASVASKVECQGTKRSENPPLKEMLESFREAARKVESAAEVKPKLKDKSGWGKMIVIEGLDRSGKTTQSQRMKDYLELAKGKNGREDFVPKQDNPIWDAARSFPGEQPGISPRSKNHDARAE